VNDIFCTVVVRGDYQHFQFVNFYHNPDTATRGFGVIFKERLSKHGPISVRFLRLYE